MTLQVNAYSDIVSTNTFLRHLFLCQVLYDPLSGQMVPIAPGTEIHVEMGTVVGKRDMHTMKRYATEELMQSLFPSLLPGQLNLALLYPILNLVAVDRSNEVRNFELLDTEQHYSGKATRAEDRPVHWNVECDMCKECPVRGPCYKCVDCPDFDICARWGGGPNHKLTSWHATNRFMGFHLLPFLHYMKHAIYRNLLKTYSNSNDTQILNSPKSATAYNMHTCMNAYIQYNHTCINA